MDPSRDKPAGTETIPRSLGRNISRSAKFPSLGDLLTPPWCRWDVSNPAPLTAWLNLLFAFAGAFTSANLSYSYPILNVLAKDFNVSQASVATIPTVALVGSVAGLLFILPLADFFPRRRFVLVLVALAAVFWAGICATKNLNVFLAMTFLSGLFNGSTQIMLPLVAELSTPETRAWNISIVAAGPTLGIVLARILSGIVTEFTNWRNIFWLALGLQGWVFIGLWLYMPDYPPMNSITLRRLVRTYPKILWSIVMLFPKYPVLVQASLLSFCTFITVSSYWTTLTFLLSGSPFHYNSIAIGLFGLAGLATMVLGPVYGKFIVNPLKQPLFSAAVGKTVSLVGIVVGTYSGIYTVAGPIIQALLLDAGLMILQISNRVAIHEVEPQGRNRVNTAFVSMLYLGQVIGTYGGNIVYEKYGGWIASGSLSVGVIAFSFLVIAARGPHERGWIGWTGGWKLKSSVMDVDSEADRTFDTDNSIELREIREGTAGSQLTTVHSRGAAARLSA